MRGIRLRKKGNKEINTLKKREKERYSQTLLYQSFVVMTFHCNDMIFSKINFLYYILFLYTNILPITVMTFIITIDFL